MHEGRREESLYEVCSQPPEVQRWENASGEGVIWELSVRVDCRLRFSECISTINLHKSVLRYEMWSRYSAELLGCSLFFLLVFEIHEQTRQQKLRDVLFPLFSEISTCRYLRVCSL